jgi:uncharacterized protein YutE (UPF0331/DUF86 family)
LVDREVFDRRLARLEQLLRQLRSIADRGWEAYRADPQMQAAAERWLQLAAECALDLANHVIADRGFRTPSTYRETFRILHEEGILSEELARKMEAWAGLRNVLVHLYLEVDPRRLFDILSGDLDDLSDFAAALVEACRPEDEAPEGSD